MHNTCEISPAIHYVGASDRQVVKFENMFPVTKGIAYNSYLILDEKTAVLDTVDRSVSDQFLENIEYVLANRTLDYLIINHMEPDHCANIEALVRRYPDVTLVGNVKTFKFLHQFYPNIPKFNQLIVKEKDTLCLGKHQLEFYLAPNVHWPEVMVTFEKTTKTLFSSDAFGSFNALNGNLFTDEIEFDEHEFRRYYSNIIGKYGSNVNALLKKIESLSPNIIAPLHGTIHRKDTVLNVLALYKKWASYIPQEKGVVIAFSTMYGNTAQVCEKLAMMLAQKGIKNIQLFDVANVDASYIISEVFKYSHLVVGVVNYNTKLYYPMKFFLEELSGLNIQNRYVSFITNGSWGGTALKQSQDIILANKNMIEVGNPFTIQSAMNGSQLTQLYQLADDIIQSVETYSLNF